MPTLLARHICIIILAFQSMGLAAQDNTLQAKLAQLKKDNDLTNWIYEQLDAAHEQPQKAIPLLLSVQKEHWRLPKTGEERFVWLNLLSTLGYYQLLDGDILASINSYESAFSYFRKYQILDYDIVEYILKPLSNNYTRLGDYERALFLQQQSIDFLQQYKENPEKIAPLYCNMAISFRAMSRLTDAHKAIQKGFSLNPNTATVVMLNNVYADVLYDEGSYHKAEAVITENIKRQKQVGPQSAYWLMSAYTTAGNIYLATAQNTKAKTAYQKALQLLNRYEANSRIREKANLYTQLGKTFLAEKKAAAAIIYGYNTLATLGISNDQRQISTKNIYGDNKLIEVFLLLANAHQQLSQPEQALDNVLMALLSANKIRNEFAADITKERLQNDLKQIAEKGISISYQLYQQKKSPKYLEQILHLAEQSKSRTLLDQMERNQRLVSKDQLRDSLFIKKRLLEHTLVYREKQTVEHQLAKDQEDIDALKFNLALVNKAIAQKYQHYNQRILVAHLQLAMLPKHRFVEYFVGEEDIYLISITANKITEVIKLPHAKQIIGEIQTFMATYFQQGPNAMMNNPKAFFQASHHIYQRIFAPLHIKANEKLTIVPDGVLGYLSFESLISQNHYLEDIRKWPFALKQNAIDYAFSLRTLQAKFPKPTSSNFTGLFINHKGSQKTELRAMETEATLIQKNIRGTFLFNHEVSPQSFERLFEQSNVMHIGTHAYLSGQKAEPTLDFDREKVYLFELSSKKSAPALVVLSACRTADGTLANGEGIISFSRGFTAMGTSGTIASLWNVNDETAATITANFYQALRQLKNPSEALRSAKLDWLNNKATNNALLLPYYWDSLVYMGKQQEIELSGSSAWLKYGMIGFVGVCCALTAIYYMRRRRQHPKTAS